MGATFGKESRIPSNLQTCRETAMLEFADYFDVLKKRKWVLLVWLVVGLVGAGVAFLLLPKSIGPAP